MSTLISSIPVEKTKPHAPTYEPAQSNLKLRLTVIIIGSILILAHFLISWFRAGQIELANLFALAGAAIASFPVMLDAIKGIQAGGFNATRFYMDQFIALAVIACFAIGEYVTGGVVAIVLVLGQILEERSALGAKEAAKGLMKLTKTKASRLLNGKEELLEAEQLQQGDCIVLRPGDTVPADATVISGSSAIDQATITGESVPVDVYQGCQIFAGTINKSGVIRAEVKSAGDQTVLGRVKEIVTEAQTSEAPIIRLAEQYTQYYTPLILILAGLVFFFTREMERAISVIIVSIPCAFVLASPSAMVAALASASRMGIVIKSTKFLEVINEISVIVFDKTGTLTTGQLRLNKILSHEMSEHDLLSLAASACHHSTHPLSRAIVQEAKQQKLPFRETSDMKEHAGQGIQSMLDGKELLVGKFEWLQKKNVRGIPKQIENPDSVVAVSLDGQYRGVVLISDQLRKNAHTVNTNLQRLGIVQTTMLTGDREIVAKKIANELGLESYRANCLPEDKMHEIEQLCTNGARVMVVGDGVNDAPALAAGNVGVAMGALGSDIAIQTADIALMSNELDRLPSLLGLSHQTLKIINQNLLCGLILIIIALVLSSLGYMPPIMAALFHEFSAFFVIFNSARLLRYDETSLVD
ncbi:MAG: cation-translocating P-type ATPase [Verrucomicrobiota bacterium]